MRVLITVHQFFPEFTLGTERYTLALAKGLQAMGDDVTVLTVDLTPSPESMGHPIREYHWDGIRVLAVDSSTSPIRKLQDYHTRPDRLELYKDVLFDYQPDIVHCCHLLHLGVDFLTACDDLNIPVTATLTDLWGICWAGQMVKPCDNQLCSGPGKNAIHCAADFLQVKKATGNFSSSLEKHLSSLPSGPLQRSAIRAASSLPRSIRDQWIPDLASIRKRNGTMAEAFSSFREVWYPSRFLQESCEEFGLIEPGLGKLLTYGIRIPNAEEKQALQSLPNREGPAFAFIGQMARHKGLDLLIDAFAAAKIPGATLSIHGKPNPGDPHASAILDQIKHTPGVTYCGSFNGDDIYTVLRDVDAVVVPSIWHENAPLVMLEALSAGRPVLTSRARGMVDFVEHGRTGLIFDMNSTLAIREALVEFASNQDKIQQHCLKNPGYQFTPADHAAALREGLTRHALPANRAPMRRGCPPLARFLTMRGVETPLFSKSVAEFALKAGQAGAKGCEVRIPASPCLNRESWDAAFSIPKPPSAKSTPAPTSNALGSTFPTLERSKLLLRPQQKPYASLWGKGTVTMQWHKLQQIDTCTTIRLCARPKNGTASKLKITGTQETAGDESSIELVHNWNWSSKHWTEIELDLEALRKHLTTISRIEWIPMNEKAEWKLDVAGFDLLHPPLHPRAHHDPPIAPAEARSSAAS
ncbi:glycosyltransferase [Sulfuriroseicoccus oceanibius]|uniref:Glycosyltransferase n=1 Tax=Sulfuriroseicoccus oceanibius TaxID=2707525 RepID=A0A6B3LES7_9BACT|nr:glycosyltransferase [Sulfuriroseicoccus oceanibius]QQL44977.1 glycosyltransferase [Sulfuriroseicoccus oceanibius]